MPTTPTSTAFPPDMPDRNLTMVSRTVWYVTELRVIPEYYPRVLKAYSNRTKVELYVTRQFELDCKIDKKLEEPELSLERIMRNLSVISVNGLAVTYRLPQLSPVPAGCSTDTSKDLDNDNYEWKIQNHYWEFNMERNLYTTTATVTGAWSKWCYLGINTITEIE